LLDEPALAAINVALAKARATEVEADEAIVAADTLVVVDGEILGKPLAWQEASAMLERLRGRAHQVMTGVVVRGARTEWAATVTTTVLMRNYTGEDISAYISRGEPFDKAGGYAIQDQTFRPVERLEGCYLNVVGLPLCAVAAGLNATGVGARSAGVAPCEYCRGGEQIVRSG
jgi:MAF protein